MQTKVSCIIYLPHTCYITSILAYLLIFNCFFSGSAQSLNYCDTSLNLKANVFFNEALTLNETGENGAIKLLKKAIELDTSFAAAYYLLGEIHYKKALLSQYDIQNQSYTPYYFEKSITYFKVAIALCDKLNNYGAHFYLGEYYYFQKDYAAAEMHLNQFVLQNTGPGITTAKKYAANCKKWLQWHERKVDSTVFSLQLVCTSDDEMLPFVPAYGQILYYVQKSIKLVPNSMFESEIKEQKYSLVNCIDSLENWVYAPGKKMGYPFNTGTEYDAINTNATNTEMFLSVSQKQKKETKYIKTGQLLYSEKKDNYWDEPIWLPQNINFPNCYNGQATVSHDGKLLIFVSDRPGGKGGTDLYYSRKDSNNQWQNPINMGYPINTINDEASPFLHYDQKTLYFTSNGHFGLGGMDIFVTQKTDSTWTEPQNMELPINSSNDELGLVMDARGTNAYFASNHFIGKGGWDIFSINIPEQFRPEQLVILNGRVTGSGSTILKNFELKIVYQNGVQTINPLLDFTTGSFAAIFPKTITNGYLQISSKGYSFGNCYFQAAIGASTLFINCELTPLKIGNSFFLHHMHFNQDLNLPIESNQIIADFSQFMITNGSLKINILGVNNEGFYSSENQMLKTKAQQVYNLLIQNGISEKRLAYSADTLSTKKRPSFNPTQSEILIEITEY